MPTDASIAPTTTDRTHNVVPAWRIEVKRQERAERIRRATSTILDQAISGEADGTLG